MSALLERALTLACALSAFSSVAAQAQGAAHTVPAAPWGPTAPAHGWGVEYADSFTRSFGASEDNTWFPNRGTGGEDGYSCQPVEGFNSDEMESFNCSAAKSGTKSGLQLSCSYTPGVSGFYSQTQNYTCGTADQQNVPPAGYRFFSFKPGEGYEWAIQIRARFPVNTGEADPGWWADDPPYNEEIDWFEGFGWQAQAGQGWCGSDYTGTTDPTWIYDKDPYESIGGETWICRDQGFDPSAGMHTYTTVVYPNNTMAEYIDGKLVTWTWSPGGGSDCTTTSGCTMIGPADPAGEWYSPILSYGLRDDNVGNPDPYFESGVRSFDVRYVAFYEGAGADNANTENAGLAPGTAVK